jgi:hypothetical protein
MIKFIHITIKLKDIILYYYYIQFCLNSNANINNIKLKFLLTKIRLLITKFSIKSS